VNRPPAPARGSETVKGDAPDEGFEALGPVSSPLRTSSSPDIRSPWGRLEGFTVRAVLRLLEAEQKDCTVSLQEGGRRALVHLRAGRPVHAECGPLAGQPALDDVLRWADPVVSIARLRYEGAPTFEPPSATAFDAERAGPAAEPAANGAAKRSAPYARLVRLADAGETGEFVVAHAPDEFHVHLHQGHVVWAAGRHTRERFRRRLFEFAGTRGDDLQAVLEECRRSRLPLVETLVQRNLASPDQVRQTFAAVFRDALSDLRALSGGDCVFLRRTAEVGQDAIAFPLRGLEPAPDAPNDLPPAPEAPPKAESPSPRADEAPAPKALTIDETPVAKAITLDELLSALDAEKVSVEGVCLTRGLAIVPGNSRLAFVPSPGLLDLMGGPATERAELVVLRSSDAAVIGQRIGARPLVAWCRTRLEACSPAQELLARLGGSPPPAPPAPQASAQPGRALRVHHDRLPTGATAELTKLFTDNPELISTIVVGASARSYLAVDGPAAPPLTRMLRRALSSANTFGPQRRDVAVNADAPPPLLGARFAEGWWFGGPLLREPGHYAWLLLQPSAAQALGWLMAGRLCRRFGLHSGSARV
jgi:uncharacterized protein DUF4388